MRIESPNGTLEAIVDEHDLTLAIERGGREVLRPSPLVPQAFYGWLSSTWAGPEELSVAERERREIDATYRVAYGKESKRRHRAREVRLACEHEAVDPVVGVEFRVATDGVAYRYRIPGGMRGMIQAEGSAFRFPRGTTAWLHSLDTAHESIGHQNPVNEVEGEYSLPGLFETGEEWVLMAEAGVDGDYAAAHVDADAEGFEFGLPNTSVHLEGPTTTPWRVAIVGDLGTVVESTLVTDLVGGPEVAAATTDQSAFEHADWIRPGRVAWSWWSESDSPSDFERQREYVEYATDRGWEYVLVDDGWQRNREAVSDLIEYARERDVGIFLWAQWTELNSEAKRTERLATWADWGIDGIKVDFMDHDDQGRMQFYDALAEDAAAHGLLVNFHGSIEPRGLQRRHPNVMTYEGVMGAEYYKWNALTPTHNCVLPFTRNVVGPMDYTPVTFSAETRKTTAGHELALAVVYESALAHFADSIDEYANRPEAEAFLEAVPAAWDETRFVHGHPGTEATIARRRDDEWFLGSITAGPQRIVSADCAFLDQGEWDATVLRDDGQGGLVEEALAVTAGEAIDVVVPRHGGFVARFA